MNDHVATKEGLAALEAKVDELAVVQDAIREHLDELAAGQSVLGAGVIAIRDRLDQLAEHLGV